MRSKSETFEAYAEECARRAAAVNDRQLKALFSDLALQWRELAATTRMLQADAKAREKFFKRGGKIPAFFRAPLSPLDPDRFRTLSEPQTN
jgi:hypothetical protein